MRIKSLKLHGFKSFADKTTITFDDNFIGVVGPNGSGKSNVIDAIRWVFGEKSNKSLRGSSSTDIIFGGTERRKRQNIAEVTITLDNTDGHLDVEWNEVAFTRRLYRSGKSEYLINGVEARYKDIQELILDKGIGKNAFSIISQGKIEEIITTTPEQRRLIVEEVAGILKYKKRKESALAKLAKTDDNLDQVNLILQEIDERRGPLERQAQVARKYQEYKTQLEQYEVDLLATRLNQNKEQLSGLSQLVEDGKVEIMKLEAQEASLDAENGELKTHANELSINLNALNIQINEINKNLQTKRTNLHVLNERNSLLANQKGRQTELQRERTRLNQQLFESKETKNEANARLRELQLKNEQLQEQLRELKAKFEKFNLSINDLNQELNKKTIPFATRKVLASNIKGVVASVEERFSVDLKHTEAILTIIGARVYDIITTDRAAASLAIDYLKKNKYGRQTFLPRDAMRTNTVSQQDITRLKAYPGFVGIAVDLIKFETEDAPIFKNLLGTVIVCEDLKAGTYIASELTNRYRIVSLEGDVIQTSGAMSGGASKRTNKLVLEAKIAKLKHERMKLEAQVQAKTQQISNLSEQLILAQTNDRMENAVIERLENELQLVVEELKKHGDNAQDDLKSQSLEHEISDLEVEISKRNEEHVKLEFKQSDLKTKAEQIEHELRVIREDLKSLNRQYSENQIKLERVNAIIKTDLANLREEYQMSMQMAIENSNLNVDIDAYEQQVNKLKSQIRNLGPINLLAIEEYEQLTERFTFIDEQRSDLLIAKVKLEDIIRKLDCFFVEAFETTYNKLRTEFKHVYEELFGGGHADLVLTNDEDLLQAGVEIVAQPPGKKLQTISLLSGGEKALTAIALLFAILRIRTLPFAILDEVEAALDEANVKRYAKYIKVFSERTQFIVITHRQGTMETVDNLYGVTMQEKGVSTVVKVSLKEGEKYA